MRLQCYCNRKFKTWGKYFTHLVDGFIPRAMFDFTPLTMTEVEGMKKKIIQALKATKVVEK